MVKRISAKIMPHSGSIIRAYRDRRIVQRRQQIAPYVFDLRGGFSEGVHHIGTVCIQDTGHDALLVVGVRLPEKELCGVGTMRAIGGDSKALFAVVRGNLNTEPVAAVPAVPGDAGAVRQIVRQAVAAADALADGCAANEIISVAG